jgi:SpoVK/Ycf46/Vps4 family AAA+-type ATPase
LEVAYLLQRLERFDGLALLSTNLRSNIDEAFVRRFDAVVEFPMPDAPLRRSLWERGLVPQVPRADDLDLDFLSTAFSLSGGNIRSVCLSAAYAAAETGEPVTMAVVVRCLAREYRKLGRLCTESDFGRYWPLVAD